MFCCLWIKYTDFIETYKGKQQPFFRIEKGQRVILTLKMQQMRKTIKDLCLKRIGLQRSKKRVFLNGVCWFDWLCNVLQCSGLCW